jgi:hypothetical protein
VTDGAAYSGQLTVTNATGTVSYTETFSSDFSDVVVNSFGRDHRSKDARACRSVTEAPTSLEEDGVSRPRRAGERNPADLTALDHAS